MADIEYDQNYAPWLIAAGLVPNSNPINIRGVIHQIIENLGGGSSSVPVDVPSGTTYTVGANTQALFRQVITVEGIIRVNGLLVGVA